MPDWTGNPQPKLLNAVRQVLRLHHYSIHTERSYVEWIVRFVRFYGMRSREDLFPAEPKIESFLTDLALNGNVAAATQKQAMNALVFLYKRVLNHAMEGSIAGRQEDQRPRSHDTRRSRRRHLSAGRNRPTGCQTSLRERLTHHGGRPAQGQGHRFSDEATDCPFRQGRQGPVYHLSCHAHPFAPKPPGRGQDVASAGFSSGAWRDIQIPPRNGAGSMSFPPGTSP